MVYPNKQTGFTLVEMIGVMAVIAILASVAAPRVFESIEDAKVTKLVQQIQTIKTASAKFYADTGTWPLFHNSATYATNDTYHTLIKSNSIQGWQGPYLDKEPAHPFQPSATLYLVNTATAAYQCDSDGDGTTEGPWLSYYFTGMTLKTMEKVSNIIDSDGGATDWGTAGLVKQYNGNSTTGMVVCLTRTG
ncbi:MAG: prepilin-type N-terminal cleavage/methylation domain-containing protein [Gammaproteobacteria bacterium]